MTTPDQHAKFLRQLEAQKDKGIPEDSIVENLDDFVAKLIRHGYAQWIATGDHDNLVLTKSYSQVKVQKLL